MDKVYACQDCGEEVASIVYTCPVCGGSTEQVDPVLVAALRGFEAGLALGSKTADKPN